MKLIPLCFFLVFSFTSGIAQTAEGDKILGLWLSENKNGKIQVYKQNNKYFGKLTWSDDMYEADGKTSKKDKNNKNEKLRSRDLKDLMILTDFVYDDGEWTDGEIYDPESGNTYSCTMKMKGSKLDIRGYIGISLLGRTSVWERVE